MDVDSVEADIIAPVIEAFFSSDLALSAYTTFSHPTDDGRECWRLIFPLTRPVNLVEYKAVTRAIAASLPFPVDHCSHSGPQLYFLPTCEPRRKDEARILHKGGRSLDVEKALGMASSGRVYLSHENKSAHLLVKPHGTISDVYAVAEVCRATAAMLKEFEHTKPSPSHVVRRSVAQLCISLGLTDSQIVSLFSSCENFQENTTRVQLSSLRRGHKRPSCMTFAEVTGACSGECEASKKARTRSPAGLIAWEYLGVSK